MLDSAARRAAAPMALAPSPQPAAEVEHLPRSPAAALGRFDPARSRMEMWCEADADVSLAYFSRR